MTEASLSRRSAIGHLVLLPLGLALAARASASEVCFDPDALPASQRSFRKSLGFELKASDPSRACIGCAFYTASSETCGTCRLLSGGPVEPTSTCRSFAAKS